MAEDRVVGLIVYSLQLLVVVKSNIGNLQMHQKLKLEMELEGVESRELFADDELVDSLRALVGHDGLEIEHVADGFELDRDAARPEQLAATARNVQRHTHVVPLAERDLGRVQLAPLLAPAQMQGE